MATSVGVQKVRRQGGSYIVTIPAEHVKRLGLETDGLVEVLLQPMALHRAPDPEVRAAAEAVLPSIQRGLDYLKDR